MRYAPRAVLAGGLGFAMSFLVACGGGSGLLSGDQGNTLSSQLDQVASAVGSGKCAAVANAVTSLNNEIDNLPASVNPALVSNLKQGVSTVAQLSVKDCRSSTTTSTTSTTPSSTTSSSTTTSTPASSPSTTSTTASSPTTSSSATSSSSSGNTPTTSGSGGAGLGGGGSGGASSGGNGNAQ